MPTDIVFQVVLFRLLFKLSLRDLMHLFLIRGYELSYETVRDWEERFAPLLADQVRRRRPGRVDRCWYVDETLILSAKSGGESESGKLRAACFLLRDPIQPIYDSLDIDRCGRDGLLQAGFG
jgi:hypothetical protein